MKPPRKDYIHSFVDRHGKRRYYFRRKGKGTALPGLPYSDQFLAAYHALLASEEPMVIGAGRSKPGTINALIARYYATAGYTTLAPITKSTYRNIIERFRQKHGDKHVATLRTEDVRRMVDARATTPTAANHFLSMIGLLMRFAVSEGMRRDDPTKGVSKLKTSTGGYHSWTDAEISQFQDRHPVGIKPRLALDLLLYTGQRREDVVRMGPQHVAESVIRVRQGKTGVELEIPLHAALIASIEATKTEHLAFLVTAYKKPFTPAGFGNWFRDRCDEAGLPHCTAHGLRKAAARRLADAGCTTHEIMAITGHKTLAEAERYTRAADKKRGAEAAMKKLREAGK